MSTLLVRSPYPSQFPGPLDDYSAELAAAYSVRRLLGSYAGAAIRVRRSSDNTEQDFGFDSAGDLDTAALLAFCGAGSGFVSTWYDQAGAFHLVEATAANQMRIVNAGAVETHAGGRPCLRGHETARGFNTPNVAGSASEQWWWMVAQPGAINSNFQLIQAEFASAWRWSTVHIPWDGSKFVWGTTGAKTSTTPSVTRADVLSFRNRKTAPLVEIYVNGASNLASSLGNLDDNCAIMGGTGSSGRQRLGGTSLPKVSEFLIWNADKGAERIGIEGAVNSYHGAY